MSLARLQITLTIEHSDIKEFEEATDFNLLPPIVDEILSVKELAYIENWKKKQQDAFEQELQRVKEQEIEKLENIWEEKKRNMEQKLENQMNKCKSLQEDLQKKLNCMKTEKFLIRTRRHANIFEEIFNENWEKYSNADIKEVIELLSKTQRDNEYLKKLVEDQRNKLQSLEKTTLTKEQTSNLLQELKGLEQGFEEAQSAKKYFKDQWQKACEGIHELKTEEYKNMQLKIRESREELKELSNPSLDAENNQDINITTSSDHNYY